MAREISFYDYHNEDSLQNNAACADGCLRIYNNNKIHGEVRDCDSDGDAELVIINNSFNWWIGCQYAIKLVWKNGQEVIMKSSRNRILRHDKQTQYKIMEYFKNLIANNFEYIPFGNEYFEIYDGPDCLEI